MERHGDLGHPVLSQRHRRGQLAGGAYDPDSHILYVYSKTEADVAGTVKNADKTARTSTTSIAAARPPPGVKVTPRGMYKPGQLTWTACRCSSRPGAGSTAIDLSKGEFAWQIAHGETPDEVKNHPALKGLTIPRTCRPGS